MSCLLFSILTPAAGGLPPCRAGGGLPLALAVAAAVVWPVILLG